MDMCCWCVLRLNRERISELQQQVEDLQKALQTQGSKPEDVSVFLGHMVVLFLQKQWSVIHEALPDFAELDVFLGQHILLTLEQHFNPKM